MNNYMQLGSKSIEIAVKNQTDCMANAKGLQAS